MRIALASCRDLPDSEVDDRPLADALEARGAVVESPAWDDPEVRWARYDACLIRTTWDYQLRRDAFVAWALATSRRTPLFNPAPVVRWNTHKRYLSDLERLGCPVIPTAWIDEPPEADVEALVTARGWQRAFLKPQVGAGADATLRFDATAEGFGAARAHLQANADRPLMLQPYYPSVQTEGELSAIFIDGRFTHAVRKVPREGDYRVQDIHGARDEAITLAGDELALAAGVLRRLEAARARLELGREPLLYARVDLLRDPAGSLRLCELELVEPSMFFRHGPNAPGLLAQALLRRAAGR